MDNKVCEKTLNRIEELHKKKCFIYGGLFVVLAVSITIIIHLLMIEPIINHQATITEETIAETTKEAPTTEVSSTEVSATEVSSTEVSSTEVPATEEPATEEPATEEPTGTPEPTPPPEPTSTPIPLPDIDFYDIKKVRGMKDYHVLTIDFNEIGQKSGGVWTENMQNDFIAFDINKNETDAKLSFYSDGTELNPGNNNYALRIVRDLCDVDTEANCPKVPSDLKITIKLDEESVMERISKSDGVYSRFRDIIVYYSFHDYDEHYTPLDKKSTPRQSYLYFTFACQEYTENKASANFGPHEVTWIFRHGTEGVKTEHIVELTDRVPEKNEEWEDSYFTVHFVTQYSCFDKKPGYLNIRRYRYNALQKEALAQSLDSKAFEVGLGNNRFNFYNPVDKDDQCSQPHIGLNFDLGVRFLTQGSVELRIYKIIIITEEVASSGGS
jgi:hypothetical protein